jgi:hypothetical protein
VKNTDSENMVVLGERGIATRGRTAETALIDTKPNMVDPLCSAGTKLTRHHGNTLTFYELQKLAGKLLRLVIIR